VIVVVTYEIDEMVEGVDLVIMDFVPQDSLSLLLCFTVKNDRERERERERERRVPEYGRLLYLFLYIGIFSSFTGRRNDRGISYFFFSLYTLCMTIILADIKYLVFYLMGKKKRVVVV
jgi:hypothetical protein